MTIDRFRELHASGCFVMPNPWDVGTAVFLQRLGFPALATTSAGFAFSRGLPDDAGVVGLDAMLTHITELVEATPLPVNADFQSGYADEPAQVAANVARCARTGVAGLSIEDLTGDTLYDRGLAVERVAAARAAIDATGTPVLLTARCEGRLIGVPAAEVLDRITAYAEAGADCVYAPGLRTRDEVIDMVRAAGPLPVNVLVTENGPARTVAELAELGVRRISLGSALARAAWGGLARAARAIADEGSFAELTGAEPYATLNTTFTTR